MGKRRDEKRRNRKSRRRTLIHRKIMKPITKSIVRDPLKVPKPISNPASALIRDTIAHHGITQSAAARAMHISTAHLCDVINQRKSVSANLALRFQHCFTIPGDLLIRLQSQFDFQKACHSSKNLKICQKIEKVA